MLTYRPRDDDAKLRVRLLFDHRVYDGATAARVLARLEKLLRGPIYDEIALQLSTAKVEHLRSAFEEYVSRSML